MGNKKVHQFLLGLGLASTLTIGTVAGCEMLVDMDHASQAKQKAADIKAAVVSTETFRNMTTEASNAANLVYDLGLIDAGQHAKIGKKINSVDFAYNNRGRLVDAETANAWEEAVNTENKKTAQMIASAMGAGLSFAGAGFLAINEAHRQTLEEKKAEKKAEEPSM